MNEIKLDDAWCVWLEFRSVQKTMVKEEKRKQGNILNPIFMNSTDELRSYQLPHSQIKPTEHIVKCENKDEKR